MSFYETYSAEIELMLKSCHRLAAQSFVTGFGGNLAWRLEPNLVLITPTMMNKGDIEAQDLVFIDLKGNTVEGNRKPTGEKPMYLKFFNERPDITSVIHCHPPAACACAIMRNPSFLMCPYYPETVTEVGPIPVVPYGTPLTTTLAENFSPYLQKYNSFLMENHGLVTMTRGTIYWSLLTVELTESSIKSTIMASTTGKIKPLTRAQVKDMSDIMTTRNLPLFGAPGAYNSLEEVYYGKN